MVIELLHRIMDVIKDYFGGVSEGVIKEQYVIVYEVRVVFTMTIISTCLANETKTMNSCALILEHIKDYLAHSVSNQASNLHKDLDHWLFI